MYKKLKVNSTSAVSVDCCFTLGNKYVEVTKKPHLVSIHESTST